MFHLHIYSNRTYVNVQRIASGIDDYLKMRLRSGAFENHNHIHDRWHRLHGFRHAAALGEGPVAGVAGRAERPAPDYIGAIERAERTPSIVSADRLARALGTTLAEMFAELERSTGKPDV